jgi:hypothetical protein
MRFIDSILTSGTPPTPDPPKPSNPPSRELDPAKATPENPDRDLRVAP